MKKVFVNFSNQEYAKIEEVAEKVGMSIPKLVEYATALYIEMPRTNVPNLNYIQSQISSFLSRPDVDTFICSTPFDDWSTMSLSAKRTAAAQIRKLVDAQIIEKVYPDSKSHKPTVYRKVQK